MDDRLVRCFINVASELHFGRAAVGLGIAQSALSTNIARLEDIVGGRLLDRGKRAAVRLTPLGSTFLVEARKAVAQLDRAERVGRRAAQGEAGPARICYVFSAALNGTLAQALEAVRRDLPLIALSAFPLETPEQLRAIADAQVDAGFLRPQDRYPEGVNARVVHREALLLAMGREHPLAALSTIRARDLAAETFIVPQVARSMGLSRLVGELAAVGSFRVHESLDASDFMTAACMSAAGYGVVLAPRSLAKLAIDDVVYRPIADFDGAVELALAWRGSPSPLVETILAMERPMKAEQHGRRGAGLRPAN